MWDNSWKEPENMATKPITFSDLSGEMGADTVKFGLGADTWEIDLTDGEGRIGAGPHTIH